MRRSIMAGCVAAVAAMTLAMPSAARAQAEQQSLVDRATLAVQEMLTIPHPEERIATLRKARAVMICPRVFQAGFGIGGAGGGCVLTARDGGGSWSSPAFYSMGAVSLGFQIGIQDSEVMMMIMTDHALSAIMDTQFKFGGDASIAFATLGAGVEGAASGAFHADIIAYAATRGLYAGLTLAGSTLNTDTPANQSYYGQPLGARGIVVQMAANNAGADPLRAMLGKFGAPLVAEIEPTPVAMVSERPPAPAPAHRPIHHVHTEAVLQQTLPPPPPPPPRR